RLPSATAYTFPTRRSPDLHRSRQGFARRVGVPRAVPGARTRRLPLRRPSPRGRGRPEAECQPHAGARGVQLLGDLVLAETVAGVIGRAYVCTPNTLNPLPT